MEETAGGNAQTVAVKAGTRQLFAFERDWQTPGQMERGYWKQVGTQPEGSAYISAGLGMGEVLNMAAELGAKHLDRPSYL